MTVKQTQSIWNRSDTELFLRFGDVFVPRGDEQIRVVRDLLSDLKAPHVLDICAGEGRLTEAYLRAKPDARVTLLDGCSQMLSVARARLEEFNGRYELSQANIEERDWRQHANYDAVMTSLAVHHLDAREKQSLYRDIHQTLRRGWDIRYGRFGRSCRARDPQAFNGAQWAEAVRNASVLQGGNSERSMIFEETGWNYYRLLSPDPIDKPSTVSERLDWLREAGFVAVDVVWMYAGHAIFAATKGATK